MALRRRAPRPLDLALAPLRAQLAPTTPLAAVQGVWAAVVGPGVAEHARPVGERAGTVTVACSAAVWAQELDLMSGEVCERLNEALEGVRITALRCVVSDR